MAQAHFLAIAEFSLFPNDEFTKGNSLGEDAPFVVFLCYRSPRDVPYRELDDEVGVGRVVRTFVTRKDRKSLVITEMIIHQLSLNPMVYS